MTKNKVLEVLGAATEDEAVEKIKLLSTPPISITIIAHADGSVLISTGGNPTKKTTESVLMQAMRMVLQASDPSQDTAGC